MSISNAETSEPAPLSQRMAILRAALSHGHPHAVDQAARAVFDVSPPLSDDLFREVPRLLGAAGNVVAFVFISEKLSEFALTESFDKGCRLVCEAAGARGDIDLFDVAQGKIAQNVYRVSARYKAIIAAAAAGSEQVLIGLVKRDRQQGQGDAAVLRDADQNYGSLSLDVADLLVERETSYRIALLKALRHHGGVNPAQIVMTLLESEVIDFQNQSNSLAEDGMTLSESVISAAADCPGSCFKKVLDYLRARGSVPSEEWFQSLRLRIAAHGQHSFFTDVLLKDFYAIPFKDRLDLFRAAASTDNVEQARAILSHCKGGPEIVPALNDAIRQDARGVAKLLIESGIPEFEPDQSPLAAAVLYHRAAIVYDMLCGGPTTAGLTKSLDPTYALALSAALVAEPGKPHQSSFIAKLFRQHGFEPPTSEEPGDPRGNKRMRDFGSIVHCLYAHSNADPYMQPQPKSGLWHSALDMALIPGFSEEIRSIIVQCAIDTSGLNIRSRDPEPAPRSRRPR